ncbi:unnamed protein product [Sympodiomycopsis kandeliae]
MTTSTPLQSISISRTEERTSPKPHVVYAILIHLPVRSWTIYRRYSEFLSLHESFLKECGSQPSVPFPPKLATSGSVFLKIFKTNEQSDTLLHERKEALERYLRYIVSNPDGTWRESRVFKEFIELPQSQSLNPVVSESQQQAQQTSGRYTPQRQQHLPGSYNDLPSTPAVRQLGSKAVVEETDETRVQSDQEVFDSQQTQFDRQDSQLNDLTAVLRRQRQMGLAINQELTEQNELLGALDDEVRHTQSKLTKNEGQIRRLG